VSIYIFPQKELINHLSWCDTN